MSPLEIEVLTYAPTEFFHCLHCEVVMQAVGVGSGVRREQRAAAFPPDLMAEYVALSDWVRGVIARYGERVRVRVVDAASLEGVIKSVRYRTRQYPTVVIGGTVFRGSPDYARLEESIAARLAPAASVASGAGGGDGAGQ